MENKLQYHKMILLLETNNHPLFVQVNVSLNLRNIFEVNEKAQYITLETSIRMYWVDPRLSSKPQEDRDFVSVNGADIKKFWVPDLFIDQVVITMNYFWSGGCPSLSTLFSQEKTTLGRLRNSMGPFFGIGTILLMMAF